MLSPTQASTQSLARQLPETPGSEAKAKAITPVPTTSTELCGITLKLQAAAAHAVKAQKRDSSEFFKATVFYPRLQDATPENQLAGLFNYFPWATELVKPECRDFDGRGLRNRTEDVVFQALEDQQIKDFEFDPKIKSDWSKRETLAADFEINFDPATKTVTLRLQSEVNNAQINHDNFNADQKLSAGGNTQETLRWVVKVKIPLNDSFDETQRTALLNQLTTSFKATDGKATDFAERAADSLRKVLHEGHATENVNTALKADLHSQLTALALPAGFSSHCKIYREQVLQDLRRGEFAKRGYQPPIDRRALVVIRLKTDVVPIAA